jgi:hypothetical protein
MHLTFGRVVQDVQLDGAAQELAQGGGLRSHGVAGRAARGHFAMRTGASDLDIVRRYYIRVCEVASGFSGATFRPSADFPPARGI